jgi:dTDP-4-amino-4,6-dideoxygalactose transaminase
VATTPMSLKTGWLRRNHQPYAVTCHSGTQALEIIAEWYMLQAGRPDTPTVAVPTLTYPATLNAFVRAGWNIHIVDTDDMVRWIEPPGAQHRHPGYMWCGLVWSIC